ncbi:MAG: hypothetical protein ACLFVL_07655 [Candidatus Aenigmatarchaeota archaeon]
MSEEGIQRSAALLTVLIMAVSLFSFAASNASASSEDLTLTAVPRDGEIELVWEFSTNESEDISVSHYNVTRDGELLTQVEGTSYVDEDVKNGVEYTYRVEVVGEDGRVITTSEEVEANPESYWWLWIALPINLVGLIFVFYYFGKKKDGSFIGQD